MRIHVAVQASAYARFEHVNYDVKTFTASSRVEAPFLLVQSTQGPSTLAG
jgi:hypothetical protein